MNSSDPPVPSSVESLTEIFSEKQSIMAIMIAPAYSVHHLEHKDKTSQCNLDIEVGRNFLMFEDDDWVQVVVPRRTVTNKVYEIEDVSSRSHLICFVVYISCYGLAK